VDLGRFKFKLIVRIAKTPENRLAVTIDIPEQGQKGLPVNALLFNDPDFRLEIDQFGTTYTGKLDANSNEIHGGFDEGPGGRPMPLTFKRSHEPDAPEPVKTFTFAVGEPLDIRGYWKGEIEIGPGLASRVALNIGKLTNGTFAATLDLLEQGATGIPANSLTGSKDSAKIEWQNFQATFDARLSEDGKHLNGKWLQGGRTKDLNFERSEGPVTLIPATASFESEPGKYNDPRGLWKGTLTTPDGSKLRLDLRVGRIPDGSLVATLASIDQGGHELPASKAGISDNKVEFEWKGIRGKYQGTLSPNGKWMEGKWEQFGNPMPLKFEKSNMPAKQASQS
jgi:hypothetical protein